MKSGWRKHKLDDCVDLLTGYPFKSEKFSSNPEDIPLVKGENVHQGYIDWDNAKRWSINGAMGLEKYWLDEGDVILAMDRPWIEAGLKHAWIRCTDPKALLVQRVSRMRGKGDLQTDYLRYIVASPAFTDYIKPIVTGVNVPHISPGQIKNFEFILPPIPTQNHIASILSAYDDLIENNTRRIKILEEMAKLIYHEWFVEFKAPGVKLHKATAEEKKVTGKDTFPEGWEETAYTDKIDVLSGGTPKTDIPEYWGGNIPWFTPRDLADNYFILDTERKITQVGLENCNSKLYPEDTVFITARGTVGRCVIAAVPMAMSQTNYALRGKEAIPQTFVFFTTLALTDILKQQATGAVFDTIVVDNFRRQHIVIPEKKILGKFDKEIESILKHSRNLQQQITNLRQTRDLLLPKLVSGEVEV